MRLIRYRVWDGQEMRISPDEIVHLGTWFDANCNIAMNNENTVFMQYSGLKDKNGIKIYEGDILETPYEYSNCNPY